MAEIKNNFLQSKMNQDLDSRLLPNGQYREGINIAINKSEGADVGAVQNVLGNSLVTDFGISDKNITCIGSQIDESTNSIFLFLTNYTDTSGDQLSFHAPASAACYIVYYNFDTGDAQTLVGGSFLNLSKTQPVQGVTILENLLFWTDNRNQPRKINIDIALNRPFNSSSPYYVREEQISVPKYYPWNPIRYWKVNQGVIEGTMQDVTSRFLTQYLTFTVVSSTNNTITLTTPEQIDIRKYCGVPDNSTTPDQDVLIVTGSSADDTTKIPAGTTVSDVPASNAIITVSNNVNLNAGDEIYIGRNPYYSADWSGDKNYLRERFIKLAYRFKFEDNEYSLISPFSQSVFIPDQDGYVLSNSQEKTFGTSTVVDFFENKVNEVKLQIDAPSDLNNFSELNSIYKVLEIDIVYKDSNDTSLKLLDTIPTNVIQNITSSKTLEYTYKSLKPVQTLPESDLIRVYDKAPVRALSQETAGNRILYGNIVAQNAVPDSLDYNVQTSIKLPKETTDIATLPYQTIEYPTHTLKENRSYQVGIVLCDKFGRQSDVILSSNDTFVSDGTFGEFGGSTVYHPYRTQDLLTYEAGGVQLPTNVFNGESLKILFNSVIPNVLNKPGYPGLYKSIGGVEILSKNSGTGTGWTANQVYTLAAYQPSNPTGQGLTALIQTDSSGNALIDTSSVVKQGLGYNLGDLVEFYDPNAVGTTLVATVRRLADPNPLGWYSYKVVVKQTEQDYYNVYLPGILNNGPQDNQPGTSSSSKAYTTLIGDNINKVPRDLRTVGPQQSLFSSSVEWWPRVSNTDTSSGANKTIQFYPSTNSDRVVRIGPPKEIGVTSSINGKPFTKYTGSDNYTGNQPPGAGGQSGYNISPFYEIPGRGYNNPISSGAAYEYQVQSTQGGNPPQVFTSRGFAIDMNTQAQNLIAEISTNKQIGSISGNQGPSGGANYPSLTFQTPITAVYETKPVNSNLDIYYETSTSGLISDLNDSITLNDNVTAASLQAINFDLVESDTPLTRVTDDFYPLTAGGVPINNTSTSITLISAINGANFDRTVLFETALQKDPVTNAFHMRTNAGAYFLFTQNSPQIDNYTFTFEVTNGLATSTIVVAPPNQLQNADPYWYWPVGTTNDPGGTVDLTSSLTSRVYSTPTTTQCPNWQSSGSPSYALLTTLDGYNGTADPSLQFPQPNKIQMTWAIENVRVYRTPSFSTSGFWESLNGTLGNGSNWNDGINPPFVTLIKDSSQTSPQQTQETLIYNSFMRGGNPYSNTASGVFNSLYEVTLPTTNPPTEPTSPAGGTWTPLYYSGGNTTWGGSFPMKYRIELRLQDANGSGTTLTKYVEAIFAVNPSLCPTLFQGVITGT